MDELEKFRKIKEQTEKKWENITLDSCYGFQIQEGSKWNRGLSEEELACFEKEMGFAFPETLRNYYRVMNGLDKPGVNVYGYSDIPFAYRPVLYGYPNDIPFIREYIDWIFEANKTDYKKLKSAGVSRIFPIYSHRFMLIDVPGNPILSMHGDDIIFWAKDIFQLIDVDVLNRSKDYSQRIKEAEDIIPQIKFWI